MSYAPPPPPPPPADAYHRPDPREPVAGVLAPLSRAFNIMMDLLLRGDLALVRWFMMGFVVLLVNCGRGNEAVDLNSYRTYFWNPGAASGAGTTRLPEEVIPYVQWVIDHSADLLVIWIAARLLSLIINAAIVFLASRLEFVFLDQVAKGHTDLDAPWKAYAAQGNSLFGARLVLLVASTVLTTVIPIAFYIRVGIPLLENLKTHGFGATFMRDSALAAAPILPVILFVNLVNYMIDCHLIPIMYARKMKFFPALKDCWGLIRVHPQLFLGYWATRVGLFFIFSSAETTISVSLSCFLCCIACIPLLLGSISWVVYTIILLPAWVLQTAYSATFLEQFGEDYRIFRTPLNPNSPPPGLPPIKNPASDFAPVAPATPSPEVAPPSATPYTPRYVPPPPMPPPPSLQPPPTPPSMPPP